MRFKRYIIVTATGGETMKINLKAARVNNKISQKEAAEHFNISRDTLRNWENGKTFPNAAQIKKIESYYNISYSDINFLC